MFRSEEAQEVPLFVSSAVAGALFGAIHCLAWHFVFPTHVEHLIWRVSSLIVVGSCLSIVLGIGLRTYQSYYDSGISEECFTNLAALLGVCLFLFYPISRICLLVLAFTSLRNLPPSAYDTIRWVDLVPHI